MICAGEIEGKDSFYPIGGNISAVIAACFFSGNNLRERDVTSFEQSEITFLPASSPIVVPIGTISFLKMLLRVQ